MGDRASGIPVKFGDIVNVVGIREGDWLECDNGAFVPLVIDGDVLFKKVKDITDMEEAYEETPVGIVYVDDVKEEVDEDDIPEANGDEPPEPEHENEEPVVEDIWSPPPSPQSGPKNRKKWRRRSMCSR
eukprot:TRINITY_DN11382_c0_g1_i1.p1 TRINITY_DN11382_c0_g1~~TRINITY_DN11382_c0_g1_i1.p1  ORF type:complete len:129 (-),score=29.31 TRINITY_DN11382_c0_g1_i1:324-710(-)